MSLDVPEPPRVAAWLVRVTCSRSVYADAIQGDLREGYAERVRTSGANANRWYWRRACSIAAHYLPSRMRALLAVPASPHRSPSDSAAIMLINDIRFASRTLRRAPGFAFAAIVALGLGTGATAAVFSLLQGVVLRPLPYQQPDRLVMLWDTDNNKGLTHQPISPVTFNDYRALNTSFVDAAAWWRPQINLTDDNGEPVRLSAVETSDNLFTVLGVAPHLGSDFVHHPTLFGPERQAIISYRLWQSRYSGDRAAIGKQVDLNGQTYTIVGVMPEGFSFPGKTDLWQQLQWDLTQHNRGARFMEGVARLRDGANVEQANRELLAVSERVAAEFPVTNTNWTTSVTLLDREVSGVFRPALFALFGASTLLLLIACINVANLLLARAVARKREVAVRSALGARRARLVRLFLTESLLLAALGSALGLLIALVSVKALLVWSPIEIPRANAIQVDTVVLAFVTLVAAVTAVGFGLFPAILMSRSDLQVSLKEGTRGAGTQNKRMRSALVVAEVALSVMLLAGSGLLIRSVSKLLDTDAGVDPTSSISVDLQLPISYSWKRSELFYTRLAEAMRANPEILDAGLTAFLPLEPAWRLPYQLADARVPQAPEAQFHSVDEGYFTSLHVPVVAGRAFTARDDSASIPVVAVNEALARQIAPDGNVLGRRIVTTMRNMGPLGRRQTVGNEHEIIGVVGDVRNNSMRNAAEPAMYFPVRQFPWRKMFLVVRGRGDVTSLTEIARREVQRLDAGMPLGEVKTMSRVLAASADPPRFVMLLMTVFAAFALTLAAVGIYGVLSFMVSHRRREIGIRMALGAQPGEMRRMIVREGVVMAIAGSVVGLGGTLLAARALGSFLYGIAPWDPLTLMAVVVVVTAVAAIACLVPASKAAGENPASALRLE